MGGIWLCHCPNRETSRPENQIKTIHVYITMPRSLSQLRFYILGPVPTRTMLSRAIIHAPMSPRRSFIVFSWLPQIASLVFLTFWAHFPVCVSLDHSALLIGIYIIWEIETVFRLSTGTIQRVLCGTLQKMLSQILIKGNNTIISSFDCFYGMVMVPILGWRLSSTECPTLVFRLSS